MKAMTLIASVLVFVIYFVCALIFESLGPFSKFKTMNKQTQSVTFKNLWFYFLNLAMIPLLLQFNLDAPLLNFFGVL